MDAAVPSGRVQQARVGVQDQRVDAVCVRVPAMRRLDCDPRVLGLLAHLKKKENLNCTR